MIRTRLFAASVWLCLTGVCLSATGEPSEPGVVRAGDAGVGRQVEDLEFLVRDGPRLKLSEAAGRKGLVVAMTSSTCPVSKRYAPTLSRLQGELSNAGIGLVLVNPFSSEKGQDVAAFLRENRLEAPYVGEGGKALATALRASSTTEVLLLDANRTLVYRGAIDDQHGLGYRREAPRVEYLRDAIAAMLGGARPRVAATEAPGCELDLPAEKRTQSNAVTYYKDVARILQQNCVQCHRDGGMAPFSLDEIDSVMDRAKTIRRVVEQGHMPPWFAAPAPFGVENPWANDRSLSAADKADLLAWAGSEDRPAGDAADAPAPLHYPSQWSIPKPDLVLQIPRAFQIKAQGVMPYQFARIQTSFSEDKWVSAMEIQPTERSVVHHVIVHVEDKEEAQEVGGKRRKQQDASTSFWAAYVPGNGGRVYPAGFARRLPAGASLVFQIHYSPNGRAVQEQMRIGLVFAKSAPDFEVQAIGIPKRDLNIPPGAANHPETLDWKVPADLSVTSLMPHMHVRGKSFKMEATDADGRYETVLDIPHYDFNWQLSYDFKQPRRFLKGSRIRITGVFDNSEANKSNPDSSKWVKWGMQSFDEMLISYMEVFSPVQSTAPPR